METTNKSAITVGVKLGENGKIESIQYDTNDIVDGLLEITQEEHNKLQDISNNSITLLKEINKTYQNKVITLLSHEKDAA